jgi:lantibiotic biosynthesis protein
VSDAQWVPLLRGELASEARRIVDDITAALLEHPASALPAFKGEAATALLLAECGSPAARPRLEQALVATTSAPMTVALFGGVAGMAWLLDHVADGPEVQSILEHFDAALERHLAVPHWQDRKDLLSGLAGIGVMLAARRDARARRLAVHVLEHFERTATVAGRGITWRNEPRFLPESIRDEYPDGMIDLGVAHGAPGVIGMLAQFIEADIEVSRSRALLERALAWYLDTAPKGCPRFGTSWPTNDGRMRIGWCYGDTGVAGVLLLVSRALRSDELAAEALELLRDAIPALEQRGAPDASFCHGAAGFAHIYNVAFQRTKDHAMHAAAKMWLERLIRMRSPGRWIAGYASLAISGPEPRWQEDATLLSGVVGIALVLLAAVSDHEPEWQRLFAI